MTFLDVFEGVEYESAIIPKLSFLKGRGGISESLVYRRDPHIVQKQSEKGVSMNFFLLFVYVSVFQ